MGIPAVEVSAVPMAKALPNVLDLPLVSRFVRLAIAAGTAEFVAPKSMTINLQELMSGAAIGGMALIQCFSIGLILI
jgi:Ca2+-dependent lipid-binding protein